MNRLVEIIQERGLEFIGRFYSRYRGMVVDDRDPDGLQRILVNIPSIHNGITIWARAGSQSGGIRHGIKGITPLPGEIVWVEFEKGNPNKPVWFYHGWANGEVPEELKPNRVLGVITQNGNKVILKDEEGYLKIDIEKSIDLNIPDKCSLVLSEDSISITRGKDKPSITLTDNGISIQKGGSSLKSTLEKLIDAISRLTVTCAAPGSPSSVPVNITEFQSIKQELKQYLE